MEMLNLKKTYPLLWRLIKAEEKRQQETIELIASENFVSPAVLEAGSSVLTNKYSEGYPGKRYYPGNEYIDKVENLAIENARKIFRLGKNWHVNVQPYSGSPANIEIYFALLEPGDTILGLKLSCGGHLTHGHKVNFSGKSYNIVQYEVDEKTGRIDYEKVLKIAQKHKPQLIISGATAYPRKINFKRFGEIARKVGAISLADISHIAGLIVAKLHPSPFPWSDVVMTTTHKTLRGPRGAIIICKKKYAQAIDRAVFPGMQGGPHDHITVAKAMAFKEAMGRGFVKYQKQVIKNARVLAQELVRYGFNLISGGTDNHLILVDLRDKKISGAEAEKVLEEVGIIANRNTVPGDESPFYPSGIRIGTPAVTTRGFKEKEMKMVAKWIDGVISGKMDKKAVRREVRKFCKNFPVPGLD